MGDRPGATKQLQPCDITAFAAGNTGIPYVQSFDSGRAGPHALICALVHGNEICGAHALVRLLEAKLRPSRGTLSYCFANIAAYAHFSVTRPHTARCLDDDFNRLWSGEILDGRRRSTELARARMLRPFVDGVDHLLDLHSTALPAPPMLLAGCRSKGLALARTIGYPAHVVADPGHTAGRRLRDYGPFDDPSSERSAMLVECGQHLDPASVDVAVEVSLRFLRACGVIDSCPPTLARVPSAAPQHLIRVTHAVTIRTEYFSFARDFACFEVVPSAGTVIARDGRARVRTPYDDCVLVLPARQPLRGQTAVRLGREQPWDDM